MARYNRINLDGKSITESRISDAEVMPGTLQIITGGKFVAPAADVAQRLYVANVAHLQGLTADDAVPAGDTIEGDYVEEGRELAVLVAATTAVVKDTPLTVGVDGYLKAVTDAEAVIAYAQEEYTVGDTAELVLVRGA